MSYTKTNPRIKLDELIVKVKKVKSFQSTTGKRYKVIDITDERLNFLRLDSQNPEDIWCLDLVKLHEAYQKLNDFATVNFKPFVPIVHSPARGLLIEIGLLKAGK